MIDYLNFVFGWIVLFLMIVSIDDIYIRGSYTRGILQEMTEEGPQSFFGRLSTTVVSLRL